MTENPGLDALRRDIDAADDAMHDLLVRRAELVNKVAEAKRGQGPTVRPGREAEILRRLSKRHRGDFPLGAVVRIWRELISASTLMQGPMKVAVAQDDAQHRLWNLARDHYGGSAPVIFTASSAQTVRAVVDGQAMIGVVPWPSEEDNQPWLQPLLSRDVDAPRIIARLPFLEPEGGDHSLGLAIARQPQEKTGDDHSLIALDFEEDMSRGRLREQVLASGLDPVTLWTWGAATGLPTTLHLVEVADYVAENDPRLNALAERLGGVRARVQSIGGFARPLNF